MTIADIRTDNIYRGHDGTYRHVTAMSHGPSQSGYVAWRDLETSVQGQECSTRAFAAWARDIYVEQPSR